VGQRSGIEVLGDDGVLRIEGASLSDERGGGGTLTEKAGFAGLLNELSDAVLTDDVEGAAVVGAVGIEPDCLLKLELGAGEVITVEEASSVEVGVLRSLDLALADGSGGGRCGWFGRRWRG
jgi:hypothetical protein